MSEGTTLRRAYVLESVRGTVPGTPAWTTMPCDAGNAGALSVANERIRSGLIVTGGQTTDIRAGRKGPVTGDLNTELRSGEDDALLQALFGGTWTANVLLMGITRRYFTFEDYFSDQAGGDNPYHRYVGCEVVGLSLKLSTNEMVKASWKIHGQTATRNAAAVASSTYSTPSEKPFDGWDGSISIGGSTATITDLSLSFERPAEDTWNMFDATRLSVTPSRGRWNVTGSFSALFSNAVELARMDNGTEVAMALTLNDPTDNALLIELPRVLYTGATLNIPENKIVQNVSFEAVYDTTETSTAVITRTPHA